MSGKRVLTQWFSYRKRNRERPIIGDRRPPSKLGDIQPDHWLAEYTTELLNVLHVLGRLVELEPAQAELLERICAGPTITAAELTDAKALPVPGRLAEAARRRGGPVRGRVSSILAQVMMADCPAAGPAATPPPRYTAGGRLIP